MPIVIESGTPAASMTVTPRKWEMPFASRASTRMVLPGPSGTWRVTVIVVPVTGTVCTMSAIPAPRMVKRMAVTVDGIVADSGRGVAREEAVAGAAEAAGSPDRDRDRRRTVSRDGGSPAPRQRGGKEDSRQNDGGQNRRFPASRHFHRPTPVVVRVPGSMPPSRSDRSNLTNLPDGISIGKGRGSRIGVRDPVVRVKTAPAGRGDPVPAGALRTMRGQAT